MIDDKAVPVAKTKVFISYSRKDMAVADRLVAALEARGCEVRIDRRDLPLLEEWQRELIGFIRQSDAAVLLLSPSWVASPWCAWEVERMLELNKRLAPVVIEPVDIDLIPEPVRRINLLQMSGAAEFDGGADALAIALTSKARQSLFRSAAPRSPDCRCSLTLMAAQETL